MKTFRQTLNKPGQVVTGVNHQVITISLVVRQTTRADALQLKATRATRCKRIYRTFERFWELPTIAIYSTLSLSETAKHSGGGSGGLVSEFGHLLSINKIAGHPGASL